MFVHCFDGAHRRRATLRVTFVLTAVLASLAVAPAARATSVADTRAKYVVIAVNDLGMHCYQRSYAGFMILPPANTLKAQVFRRGDDARLVRRGIIVTYKLVGNTTSAGKTDFWKYAGSYGYPGLKRDVGITGNRLSGRMKLSADGRYWVATAIPATPYNDRLVFNPLQVARITVRSKRTGAILATLPKVVVPVSDEMRCDFCHGPIDTAGSILRAHDAANGTTLAADLAAGTRHACSECHADNALGRPGNGALPLSQAVHGFHADKMTMASVTPSCYACHPGAQTKCLRGRMAQAGFTCTDGGCHGSMSAVADSQAAGRRAWLDEPRCDGCHDAAHGENPATLYRDSYLANGPEGMNVVLCESCHNSPHAEWRSSRAVDNAEPLKLQGLATYIKRCAVCHPGRGKVHGNQGD